MAAITAGLGVALSAIGTVAGVAGSLASASAQKKALAAQERAEALRQRQLNLEAQRKQREIYRKSIEARATALSTATNQGAADPGGSAVPGAYGSIAGEAGTASLGVEQNRIIGNKIFDENRSALSAYRSSASASSLTALGSGISSLGGAFVKNLGAINRIGAGFGE